MGYVIDEIGDLIKTLAALRYSIINNIIMYVLLLFYSVHWGDRVQLKNNLKKTVCCKLKTPTTLIKIL